MVVCVLFRNGCYFGVYDSVETAEKAVSRPDSKVSRNSYYLNVDGITYEILMDTVMTENRVERMNKR
jgi:hypothetical protein